MGLVAALAAACGPDEQPEAGRALETPLVAFDTMTLRIETAEDTFRVRAEIAASDEQRSFGLMERTSLAEDAGMLFVYDEPQPAGAGFWMFHTRIPLDIAFIDAGGRIVSILRMEPCESPYPQWCPTYDPGVAYSSALEVNAGYFAERGIRIGDRVMPADGSELGAR